MTPKYLESLDAEQILQKGDGWFRANGQWVEIEESDIGKKALPGFYFYFRPFTPERVIPNAEVSHER